MKRFITLVTAACGKLIAGFENSRLMAALSDVDELTLYRHPDAIANRGVGLRQRKNTGQRRRSEAVDGRVARRRDSIRRRGMDQTSDDPRMSDGLPMADAL